jgi:hypothetical protein
MGVVAGFDSVPPDVVKRCSADAEYLYRLLSGEENPPGSHGLYLDKAWDGICYLISPARRKGLNAPNGADVLRLAIDGVVTVNDEVSFSYGPPMLVPPQVVAQAAAMMALITPEMLAAHFDPEKMEAVEVSGSPWDGDGDLSYLTNYFEKLKAFYAESAADGHAVIVTFS